jgi:hypothetical protein
MGFVADVVGGVVEGVVDAAGAVVEAVAEAPILAAAATVLAPQLAPALFATEAAALPALAAPSILGGGMTGAGMLTSGLAQIGGATLTGIGGIGAGGILGTAANNMITSGLPEIGGANLSGGSALNTAINSSISGVGSTAVTEGVATGVATSQTAAGSLLSSINTDAVLKAAADSAIKNAIISGGTALVTGGDPLESALIGGLTGGVGGGVGNIVQQSGLPSWAASGIGGATSGLTGALVNDGDILQSTLTGGLTGVGTNLAGQLGDKISGKPGSFAGKALSTVASKAIPFLMTDQPSNIGIPSYTPSTGPSVVPVRPSYVSPTAGVDFGAGTITALDGTPVAAGSTKPAITSGALPVSQATPTQITSNLPTNTGTNMQLNQLKQLYPQLANIDPKLLNVLQGGRAASPTYYTYGSDAGGATGLSSTNTNQPTPGYPAMAANTSTPSLSSSPLTSGFNALTAAGLGALNTGDISVVAKKGGEIHEPQFITGATGHYVQGAGDGQSDDIPAMLADGEYVFDADTVAQLGNGSNKAGALVLDKMRANIRKHKRSAPANKIPPKAKSPLSYLRG